MYEQESIKNLTESIKKLKMNVNKISLKVNAAKDSMIIIYIILLSIGSIGFGILILGKS